MEPTSTAPLDGLQFFTMCRFRDFCCFSFGAVIAPEVVFTERM